MGCKIHKERLDMGHRINNMKLKSSLVINKEDFDSAYNVLKSNLLGKKELNRIDKTEINETLNLFELVIIAKWELLFDNEENAFSIYNHNLNVAEEELLFKSIAPFVKEGSFVEYERDSCSGTQKDRFDFSNKNVVYKSFLKDDDANGDTVWKKL